MHVNKKFKRYSLSSKVPYNNKLVPAYYTDNDGAIHRSVVRMTKKWRKNNGRE